LAGTNIFLSAATTRQSVGTIEQEAEFLPQSSRDQNLDMTPSSQCTNLNPSRRGTVLRQTRTFVFIHYKTIPVPPTGATTKDYEKKQMLTGLV
jgi:hypothetical protein